MTEKKMVILEFRSEYDILGNKLAFTMYSLGNEGRLWQV